MNLRQVVGKRGGHEPGGWKAFKDSVLSVLVSILSADLLYLYFIGAWHDSIKAVEVFEVVVLFVLVIWGIVETVVRIRKI